MDATTLAALEMEALQDTNDYLARVERERGTAWEGKGQPKTGERRRPCIPVSKDIWIVFDGSQYVVWKDSRPTVEEIYQSVKNAKEWIEWWDQWNANPYPGDPIGKLVWKASQR